MRKVFIKYDPYEMKTVVVVDGKEIQKNTILERNICYRNEIKEWCVAMQDELVPNLDNFTEEEVNKILAILAFEKNRIEGKREYEELINNLLIFMDGEKRRM